MEEKDLSGEESLQLINRMIYEAKGYFYESGTLALIFGFSLFMCSTLSFLSEKHIIHFPLSPFYLMIPVFFLQGFIYYKEEKKKKAKTFTDEAIDYVCMGFFVSVIFMLAGSFAGAGYFMITISLFLAGFAAFLTGMITKFRYHIVCGLACLVIAAFSFFVQNENIYFLLAAVSAGVWIIPGFLLKAYFKKHAHE